MREQSLNGVWRYRIGRGEETERTVPFSALAVGHSECRREFDLQERSDTVLLRFDGITYAARVTLNGHFLGEMAAYSEYTFDVSDIVRERDNQLLVELEDIDCAFGPTEGWENFGGIIRDVALLYRDKSYIKDVFFHSSFPDGYTDADYQAEVTLGGEEKGEVRVSLCHRGQTVDEYVYSGAEQKRRLCGVSLWSPDTPELYELRVALYIDGQLSDEYACSVGFREFTCAKHRFLLNGQPIFLQGVCKHEMIGDSGHVVSRETIESDLLAIKETGCNFVRLVHYPHCKATLEIADRIGLMVSEEPGLWWSDTSNEAVSRGSLEVLRRTVLRDRNHPSIVFWLCFNECIFTEQFLIESARVCRESDPTRPVSGANCMSDEDTLKYYKLCGFDFYTMHPYSDTFERARRSASLLNDKPLMFTEWGGYFLYDNPHLTSDFIEEMYALYEANDDSGALAGASFWYWGEARDYGRGGPACVDGVLKEALVDTEGNPTMIYKAFCDTWRRVKEKKRPEDSYYFEAVDSLEKRALKGNGGSGRERLMELVRVEAIPKFAKMRGRKITVGPLLSGRPYGLSDCPYLLCDGDTLCFEGESVYADSLTVIGMVSLPVGYPIRGKYGESAATLCVEYSDGERQTAELRNGIEFSTLFASLGSSRIDPKCERAERFAAFGYDRNFENYILNRLDVELVGGKKINKIEFNSLNRGYGLLIYGVFI